MFPIPKLEKKRGSKSSGLLTTKILKTEIYHLTRTLIEKKVIVKFGFGIVKFSIIRYNPLDEIINRSTEKLKQLKKANEKCNNLLNESEYVTNLIQK